VILGGPLKGKRIFTSWHDYPGAILGTTEKELLAWFSQNVEPGQTWLDVGAHYGYTALALSGLVGPEGSVFAFEPVLATASCIAQTRLFNGLDKLHVVPLGLSAECALRTKRLAVVRGMADSTIDQSGWTEPILVAAFDGLWTGLRGEQPKVDGVKIDVQGMELDVLRGMRRTLQSDHPKLVIEFHEGVNRASILDVLRECGYSSPGESVEGNSHMDLPLYLDNRSYAFAADECRPQ
jgi:FkbM family methyltransferase